MNRPQKAFITQVSATNYILRAVCLLSVFGYGLYYMFAYDENKAKAAITYNLVDPSSAQWRNTGLEESMFCGEVNAKNRMGAYVGYNRVCAIKEGGVWKVKE
ncbi:MAG: hypothetical protein Q7R66_07555 [Undibacterium sp.]|uniref:hypothetical protein n=1 Tax=Undibacterium sp. TaxID=1914977 RepID=UPI00271C3283|nr:hypothetical protein [Undibacterium sp.]MDO8652028.1 hypothetical protein [Undibacterium sp.]